MRFGLKAGDNPFMADRCLVEEKLTEAVSNVLTRLIELTTAQLQAFRQGRESDLSHLDKELENAVGEKERLHLA